MHKFVYDKLIAGEGERVNAMPEQIIAVWYVAASHVAISRPALEDRMLC